MDRGISSYSSKRYNGSLLMPWGWQWFLPFPQWFKIFVPCSSPSFSSESAQGGWCNAPPPPVSVMNTRWRSMDKSIDGGNLPFYLEISGAPNCHTPHFALEKCYKIYLNTSYLLVWYLECLPPVFAFCFFYGGTNFSLDFRPLDFPATSALWLVEGCLWLCNLSGFSCC